LDNREKKFQLFHLKMIQSLDVKSVERILTHLFVGLKMEQNGFVLSVEILIILNNITTQQLRQMGIEQITMIVQSLVVVLLIF